MLSWTKTHFFATSLLACILVLSIRWQIDHQEPVQENMRGGTEPQQ